MKASKLDKETRNLDGSIWGTLVAEVSIAKDSGAVLSDEAWIKQTIGR